MIEPAAENIFGSWSATELPVAIEYPLEVMDELRAAAIDGLQKFARGGLEVGGVLFGVRRESGIRILTWRPIACEHALGPGLQLSARDLAALRRLLEEAPQDADLKGLQPVGWFVSHTRSEVSLSSSDQRLFAEFFPEPWHVTLVLHPTPSGPARAGFFAREAEGRLKPDASYQEFLVKPLHGPARPSEIAVSPPSKRTARREKVDLAPAPTAAPTRAVIVEPPRFGTLERRTAHRRWLWMLPVCLALLIAGVLVKQKFLGVEQSFSFQVNDAAGTLQIVWDANAPPVRASHLAVIDIQDGNETKRLSLSDDDLHQGRMNYVRHGGDVELRMAVYPVGSTSIQKFVRFIDPGPPAARQK